MRARSAVLRLVAPVATLGACLPGLAGAQGAMVEGVVSVAGRPDAGSVVYLEGEGLPEGAAPTTSGAGRPVIDQQSLRFEPRVVAVRSGTTVEFLNSDPILHNVFSPGWSGEGFDLGTYPSGISRSHTFTEIGPHVILCHVHPEMTAYVVVVPTPYHAVTDARGRFTLEGVPPGRYVVKAWRRGTGTREDALVVPDGGRTGLELDLGGDGLLVREERR